MLAPTTGSRSAGAAWCIGLVLVAAFVTGPLLRPLLRPYAYSDFSTFYSAARAFASGADPYAATLDIGTPTYEGWIGRYFYPPPFAAFALRPLAGVPFDIARRFWVLVEAAAFVTALVLLSRQLPAWPRAVRLATVGALGLLYAPFAQDLKLGSVSGLLLLLMAVFVQARVAGHAWRAAFALAAAVLLKLTPALVVVYLLVRGETRVALRTLLAGIALAAVALPWSGFQSWIDYATQVVPLLLGANFSWFTNQSLDAFWWRLFVPNPDTTPWIASPLLHRVASTGTVLAVLGTVAALAWRRRRGAPADLAEIGLVLVASLLVARVTWETMLVLALPCFVAWAGAIGDGRVSRRAALAIAAAFALAALPFPYTEAPLRSGIGLLLEAPRTYGLVLLFIVSVRGLGSLSHPPLAGRE